MNENSTRKAEVCYKDLCAKFYNENADAITTAVLIAILAVGLSALGRSLN